MTYDEFLSRKLHTANDSGFAVKSLPSWLFDFQAALVEWSLRKGRSAIFGDCGLGKTPMELVWAQSVVEHTNRPVLIVAPLSASAQTVREAEKFSIECHRSTTGKVEGSARIIVTNYERLHLFDCNNFAGMACDESSILKNFDGVTKAAITEFMRRMEYRLLCTATAAPNDYIELGTSSEALGEMGYTDMLGMFFKNDEGSSLSPLSHATKWRFKPHAEQSFWRWLVSWSRALRKPSDIGFDDGRFILPQLSINVETIEASRPIDGRLFVMPAATLQEQRLERRATLTARCEAVAVKAQHGDPFVGWCHLNDESDLLEELIDGARQVHGGQSDDQKEELFEAFRVGQLRALITKPKIGAFGLNWQHCAHMSFFPSHSYEQYYQAVRRCWRFGQTRPVKVDVITTAGEADVLGNLQRKADAADKMFSEMVKHMHDAQGIARRNYNAANVELPAWLQGAQG